MTEQKDERMELIRAELGELADVLGVKAETEEYNKVLERLTEYVAAQLGVSLIAVKPRKAKLTWEKVDAIRARFAEGEMMQVLAEDYGVTYSSISRIVTNKMWIKRELANV
jgi:hypothetical protein